MYNQTIKTLSFDRLRRKTGILFSDHSHEFSFKQDDFWARRIDNLNELETGVWFTKTDSDGNRDFVIDEEQTISGNKNLIIFVGTNDGDVPEANYRDFIIKANIKITDNSTLIFFVSQNIIIDPSVTELHGIYDAVGIDRVLFDKPTISTGEGNQQLKVYGNLIVSSNGEINLERDLGEELNKTTPSEVIIGQAKYLFKPNSFFHFTVGGWQEVAP